MTEFKQIIGRGTRINEEYEKTYFTIMDFRNVTNLFADPEFDGAPVMIKQVSEDDDLSGVEDETTDEPIIDILDGEEIEFPEPYEIEGGGEIIGEKPTKYYVNGVDVNIINERVQYLDANGKIITESLKDYTRKNVLSRFQSLNDFLNKWNSADKKEAIIKELEEQGIFFEALKDEVGKDFDPFDLICHIAFEAKPLTRKERANQVKKRDYFAKYGKKARLVLEKLLEKYADDGLLTIESTEVLKLDPLNKLGTPLELIKAFGSKQKYLEAVIELEKELYKAA
jgi:type I restriction enzyme R subunit